MAEGGAGGVVRAAMGGVGALHAWLRAHLAYEPSPLRRFDAATPQDTLRRKRGDCKDLSALAVSALQSAGREARVALTALTSPPPRDALAFPSMGWFDHVLVWAPDPREGGRALRDPSPAPLTTGWIDPTAPTPAPARLHGRLAWVLISPTEGRWLTIDARSPP
jgi:transglutaminase-like putative cysteine protease